MPMRVATAAACRPAPRTVGSPYWHCGIGGRLSNGTILGVFAILWGSGGDAQRAMPVAAEFAVDVERVGAVEVDVVMLGRGQVRGDLVSDLDAVCAQRVDRVAEIGGGPHHAGVGDQRQA